MGLCLLLVYALATPRGSAPVVAVTSADGSEGLTLTLGLLEARRKKLGHLCCRLPVCVRILYLYSICCTVPPPPPPPPPILLPPFIHVTRSHPRACVFLLHRSDVLREIPPLIRV